MRSQTKAKVGGFSMVELMVAMAIGLIGVVIIFQVFQASEGIRRTTVSGGDAQQNGAIALFSLEKDLRNAGMGINDTLYAGCNMVGSDSARTTPAFPPVGVTMLLAPVVVTAGGAATTPDQLAVFYGSQSQVMSSTVLVANMTSNTDTLRLQTRFGYRPGDLLLLLQPPGPPFTTNCVFMEATSLPANPSNGVQHDTTTYTLTPSGASVSSRFNPAGGLAQYGGTGSANVARVYNLGNLHDDINFPGSQNVTVPVYDTWAVTTNTLTVTNAFVISGGVPAANSLADNIVHMRADYGLDDGINDGTVTYNTTYAPNDGIIDHFVSCPSAAAAPNGCTGNYPTNWAQVLAIRVAVVARSALPEIPSAGIGQPCDTTITAPTWSGNTGAARSFDLSADANWKCYRYKVFETTVPLRNWLWRSS